MRSALRSFWNNLRRVFNNAVREQRDSATELRELVAEAARRRHVKRVAPEGRRARLLAYNASLPPQSERRLSEWLIDLLCGNAINDVRWVKLCEGMGIDLRERADN